MNFNTKLKKINGLFIHAFNGCNVKIKFIANKSSKFLPILLLILGHKNVDNKKCIYTYSTKFTHTCINAGLTIFKKTIDQIHFLSPIAANCSKSAFGIKRYNVH